jgi:DNA invertase Pin-like site-specific DNA recombinase
MKIGYARDSKKTQNLDLQIDALKAAGCERIYSEKGVTRAKTDKKGAPTARSERDAAMEALRPGDTLIVWKLDRIGGSLLQLLTFVEALDDRGITFVSLTEQIDTSTPTGKLFRDFILLLASFERDRLIERTLAGLEAARARGRKGGRPKALNAAQVRRARAMLKDPQITVAEVCAEMGVSRTTLYKYLGSVAPERPQS